MIVGSSRVRSCIVLACVAAVAACSSSKSGSSITPGSAIVTGAMDGRSFVAEDAAGLLGTTVFEGDTVQAVDVSLTTYSGICGWLEHPTSVGYANSAALLLGVLAPAANTIVMPGTYPVTSNGQAGAVYTASNGDCDASATVLELGQSGTITLITVDPPTISGSFDVTFGNGDRLSGTFTAPVCNASLDATSGPPITSCQQ